MFQSKFKGITVQFKSVFLLSVGLLAMGTVTPVVAAIDVFSVYRSKAPQNCVDKDIGKGKVGLSELIEIGLCNNPALNRGYMEVKAGEASLGKAKSEYLPDITASASITDSFNKHQMNGTSKSDPYNGNIALSWLLYDFGGRSARIEREKNYLDRTQFTYNAMLHDTILAIHTAYLNLLSSEEVLKSAKTSEASYKKSFEESSRRYELGLVSLSDKLQAKTSYEQSRLEVVTAQNTVKQNQGDLAVLLNLSPDTPFDLKRPPKDGNAAKLAGGNQSVQKLMEIAIDLRPEIKSAESAMKAAKENIKAAKSENLPTISASGRFAYEDDWKYENPYQYGSSAGINVSMPLFTGFANSYNISAAKYQYQQTKYSAIETRESVKNEVWSAYQSYQTSVTGYDISQRVLESAEEAERVAFAMYQVGKGDILTLLTASANLATARKEVIVAFYSVLRNKSNLYRAIGRF